MLLKCADGRGRSTCAAWKNVLWREIDVRSHCLRYMAAVIVLLPPLSSSLGQVVVRSRERTDLRVHLTQQRPSLPYCKIASLIVAVIIATAVWL